MHMDMAEQQHAQPHTTTTKHTRGTQHTTRQQQTAECSIAHLNLRQCLVVGIRNTDSVCGDACACATHMHMYRRCACVRRCDIIFRVECRGTHAHQICQELHSTCRNKHESKHMSISMPCHPTPCHAMSCHATPSQCAHVCTGADGCGALVSVHTHDTQRMEGNQHT